MGTDVDGFDVWSTITQGAASPRTEVPINVDTSAVNKSGTIMTGNYSALIQGKWKLINTRSQLTDGWWSSDPYKVTNAYLYLES